MLSEQELWLAESVKGQIADFCRDSCITRLALLGDTVPDYYPGERRIKMLAEFAPEHTPGGFAFVRMQRELGEIMFHSVDLHTLGGRRADFWPAALAEAQDIYAT